MENTEIYKKAKADIYRRLGKFCAIAWVAILALIFMIQLLNYLFSGRVHSGYALNFIWMVPLGNMVYDPLLLIGIIFFWRADKNEKTNEKSKWFKFILAYIGFYLLIGLLLSLSMAFYLTARSSRPMGHNEMRVPLKAIEPIK